MWVYLDDSGDAGFKFGAGSTSHLVMSACVFRDVIQLAQTATTIDQCARRHFRVNDFKYSKTKDTIKDDFFECIRPLQFSVRAIVIDKSKIYSDHLRSNPSSMKSWAIRQLLSHSFGQIKDAKVFIDGQDTKAFGMGDRDYFMRMVNSERPGTIREIAFTDSKENSLIQLADMTAGAILRAVRKDKPSSFKHLDTFRTRTFQPKGSLWHLR